jgi:hypothetical protein
LQEEASVGVMSLEDAVAGAVGSSVGRKLGCWMVVWIVRWLDDVESAELGGALSARVG